jgi:hypothetical protein
MYPGHGSFFHSCTPPLLVPLGRPGSAFDISLRMPGPHCQHHAFELGLYNQDYPGSQPDDQVLGTDLGDQVVLVIRLSVHRPPEESLGNHQA